MDVFQLHNRVIHDHAEYVRGIRGNDSRKCTEIAMIRRFSTPAGENLSTERRKYLTS